MNEQFEWGDIVEVPTNRGPMVGVIIDWNMTGLLEGLVLVMDRESGTAVYANPRTVKVLLRRAGLLV